MYGLYQIQGNKNYPSLSQKQAYTKKWVLGDSSPQLEWQLNKLPLIHFQELSCLKACKYLLHDLNLVFSISWTSVYYFSCIF